MEIMRESWTDDRLDYLNRRVDDGFEQVDERFKQADKRFERIEEDLREIRGQLGAMQKAMLQLGVGGIVTMVIGFLTVLSTTL
jgi:chromosome segregation ATPase